MTPFHAIQATAAVLTTSLSASPIADQPVAPPSGNPPALVTVLAEAGVETIHPGEKFLLAFHFDIAPHWHIYWKNPGDSGASTEINVVAPDGFEVGEILWQRPQLIPGMFTTYGYEDEAVLFVPITTPAELSAGEATFKADLNWLVCQESCLMGETSLTIVVETSATPVRVGDSSGSAGDDPLVEFRIDSERVREWVTLVPRDLATVEGATIAREGNRISITGPAHGETVLTVFPAHSSGVSTRIVKQMIENDRFTVILQAEINPTATLGEAPIASGVIALGTKVEDPSSSFEVALEDD
jgi:hypothetical protein